MEAKFKFHPVGQGLFYSGQIKNGKNEFNFVYDCGVSRFQSRWCKQIQDITRKYREEFLKANEDEIDLIIISHYHFDHVCGLFHGLQNSSVKVFILPYAEFIHRFLVNLEYDLNSLDNEYVSFLANPVLFLKSKFNGCKIVFIGQNDSLGKQADKLIGKINDNLFIDEFLEDNNEYGNDDVFYRKSAGRITWKIKEYIWEFLFYNQKLDQLTVNQFTQELEKSGVVLSEDCFENFSNDIAFRKKVQDAYKKLNLETNESSLMVLHQPVEHIRGAGVKVTTNGVQQLFYRGDGHLAQFLTGDINLKRENLDIIAAHFNSKLSNTAIFQIPHHGSDKNWDIEILNYIYRTILSVNVAGSVYASHPGPQVKRDYHYENIVFCNISTEVFIDYLLKPNFLRYKKLKRILQEDGIKSDFVSILSISTNRDIDLTRINQCLLSMPSKVIEENIEHIILGLKYLYSSCVKFQPITGFFNKYNQLLKSADTEFYDAIQKKLAV